MAEKLFGKTSPLGKIVWAGGQPVEVIGVLKEESGFLSLGLSEMYVPFNMLKTSFGTNDYSNVSVQTESADQIKSTGKEAARLLNDNHGTKEAYQVMNMEEIAAGIGQVTTVMTTIIGSIAGISLIVGGIRGHEYYACISDGTDKRNRHPQIARCHERTDSDTILN